jgi:peptide/nickel transport system substrate-binding protein
MKRGITWIVLTCLIITSLVLASCTTKTTSSTSTMTTTTTTSTTTRTTATTTKTATTTMPTTTAATGNWWDSLGTPQYGGTMTLRVKQDITVFDPFTSAFNVTIESAWMERLFADNWTISPSTYAYQLQFRGSDYSSGQLAQTWEFTDPNTFVVHLRHDVYWQNIPPASGRQFVASDVVAHYMRWYNPVAKNYLVGGPHATTTYLPNLASVTAGSDNFTVTFKWTTSNPEFVYECLMLSGTSENCIENPEAVATYGNLNDWHNAIGTGPFILQDFVSGSSAALVKNPNYWGTDEHYPQNRLPYITSLKIIEVGDDATAMSGFRTGKIDNLDGMSIQQAQAIKTTNPDATQFSVPYPSGFSIEMRVDKAPFTDIKVRQALQMAMNLPDIAKNYYLGTTSSDPDSMTSAFMAGWGFPYSQWPQDLKDQFAYNPTQAKALLAAAGVTLPFHTNIVVDTTFDSTLLQLLISEFADIGVIVEPRLMPYSSWTSYVSTGHNQDALAANYTGQLGRTTEPMNQIAKFVSTTSTNYEMIKDPAYDAFYTQAVAATTLDGVKKAVSDANEYLLRQHYLISLLQINTFSLVQPWLKGYSGQNNALSGSYGPSLLFFYPARFWIDQDMKTSMVH